MKNSKHPWIDENWHSQRQAMQSANDAPFYGTSDAYKLNNNRGDLLIESMPSPWIKMLVELEMLKQNNPNWANGNRYNTKQ